MARRLGALLAALLVCMGVGVATAVAAPGDPDTSFGSGGVTVTPVGANSAFGGLGVAVQSDGRIVVVGEGTDGGGNLETKVARYTAAGALDTSFGSGGVVTLGTLGGGTFDGHAIAIDSTGGIVVAGAILKGMNDTDFGLVRLDGSNGSVDSSFDAGAGVSDIHVGDANTADTVTSMVIDALTGDIFVGGSAYDGGTQAFAIVAYNSDGTPQTTFARRQDVVPGGTSQINALALDGDTVVAAGAVGSKMAIAHYAANGALDGSFDGGADLTLSLGADATAMSVLVGADHSILVGGVGTFGTASCGALVHLQSDGSTDSSFGSSGIAHACVSQDNAYTAIAQDSDGIYAAGYTFDGSDTHLSLSRFTATGSVDSSFAHGGTATSDPTGLSSQANAIALDGALPVLAGSAQVAGNNVDFAVARYLGSATASGGGNAGGGGTPSSPVSTPTPSPPPAPAGRAPVNVSAPSIDQTGPVIVGTFLTTSTGGWENAASYSYQWQRCRGNLCFMVSGETGTTYATSPVDAEYPGGIRLLVTASNAYGSITVPSAPVRVVSDALQTATGQAVVADYGLHDMQPAPTTETATEVDFMPYTGRIKHTPLHVGSTPGSAGGRPHFWTEAAAVQWAARLSTYGYKRSDGTTVRANMVVVGKGEPLDEIDGMPKGWKEQLKPFDVFNQNPDPNVQGIKPFEEASSADPMIVRVYYWDPALDHTTSVPQQIRQPDDGGPCGKLRDLLGKAWTPFDPDTIHLLGQYRAQGCNWKLNPHVTSSFTSPTILGWSGQAERDHLTIDVAIPRQAQLTTQIASFRTDVGHPGFTGDWTVAAGVQDEITVIVGDRGAFTDGDGNPIGTLSGIDVSLYYDPPGGTQSSRPMLTLRTNSRGEVHPVFTPPGPGTIRVVATGQPASGGTLSGWTSFRAVQVGNCFKSSSGLVWWRDRYGNYITRVYGRGSLSHTILYIQSCSSDGGYVATGATAQAADLWGSIGHFLSSLIWWNQPDRNQVAKPPPPRAKTPATTCAVAQTTLGAAASSDPAPGRATDAPVFATIDGQTFKAKTSNGVDLGKDHASLSTACQLPHGDVGGVAPHVATGGLNADVSKVLADADNKTLAANISSVIAAGGGNVIAAGGGNVIAAGGGNVIAAGGGNVIAAGGGNVIAAGGGNVIAAGGGN